MGVYETGGSVDGVYYSYDFWKLARLIWDRWNEVMPVHSFVPFDKLSDDTKKKLLDIAHDISALVREG